MSNDTRDLETRLRQDLGLLDWQIVELMPVVKRMVLELIGEVEPDLEEWEDRYHERMIEMRHRNELRAELRKKVEEL